MAVFALRILVDRTSIEVFVNHGEITEQITSGRQRTTEALYQRWGRLYHSA